MYKVFRFVSPPIFAVIVLTIIAGYALFIPPLIGLADNGDFQRIMAPNDLKHEKEQDTTKYFGYFNHKYSRLQYFNEAKGKIKSTHNLVLKIGMAVDSLFTKDETFDIRFVAIISLVILAEGVYWIVEVVTERVENKWIQYFLAFVAVLVFGDIGYISYFNSFFGEAIAYPFFLLSVSALLKFSSIKGLKKRYLWIFFIASFMFMGSKNQFSLNGILAFILLDILILMEIPNKKKVLAGVLGVSLLGSTILMYVVIDDNIYLINKYHMITRGVMLFEPNVEEVTKKLGIDEQFALLSETIYFDSTPAIDPKNELLQTDFYSKYDLLSVTFYYITNPKAFSKIMKFGWKNSFSIRPEILGNYEKGVGKNYGEKTYFFSLWSSFKENHIPHSSNFAYFFLVICLALSINQVIQYKNRGEPQIAYYNEIIMVYVFLTGFSQILISFIGAGDTDLKKHLFLTSVSLDILFYYYFAYGISLLYKTRNREDTKELQE